MDTREDQQARQSTPGRDHNSLPDNRLIASGNFDSRAFSTGIQLPDGQTVKVPTALLLQQSLEQLDGSASYESTSGSIMVPIIEEELHVGKRTVVTGTILLEKNVQEFQQQLDEPLAVRNFDIERIVVNRPVDTPPATRKEGDTTIYPIVEEQLILTKQLILTEEIHVTRRETEHRDTRIVTLKRESVVITRTAGDKI